MTPKDQKRIWDLDEETLKLAWLAYHNLPAIERIGFGTWFLRYYYIPGLIAWPTLELVDDEEAYTMLHSFCCKD